MATPQILSVARAFRILSSFGGVRDRMTTQDIASCLSMNYKTVHRFLLTLEQCGAVTRIGRREFALGVLLADLGQKVSLDRMLWNVSKPELELLTAEFGECAQVAILRNGEAWGVAHLPVNRDRASGIRVGQRLPLHCTAVGKVLVAGMDTEKLQTITKILRFERRTVNTILTRPAFLKEIARVRAQCFALNEEEWLTGLRAIAVPIVGRAGKVMAAISISGPVSRMTRTVLASAQVRLTECAGRISQAIYEKSRKDSSESSPARRAVRTRSLAESVPRSATAIRQARLAR